MRQQWPLLKVVSFCPLSENRPTENFYCSPWLTPCLLFAHVVLSSRGCFAFPSQKFSNPVTRQLLPGIVCLLCSQVSEATILISGKKSFVLVGSWWLFFTEKWWPQETKGDGLNLPNCVVLKGIVTNSIIFWHSFTIKDSCKKVCFYKFPIKVCIRWFWTTAAHSTMHLTMSLYVLSPKSKM